MKSYSLPRDVDFTPVGSVSQMKTVQSVVKTFDSLGKSELGGVIAHDLLLSWDTMDFQTTLDASLATLRGIFGSSPLDNQKAALAVIPNLNTEA